MKFFLSIAALALPLTVHAADAAFEKRLGRYYGLALPGGTPLVVELHEYKNEWGTALYAGTALVPVRNLTVSIGATHQTYRDSGESEKYGMLDPNSDAMRSFRQTQVEKLTSVEASDWRIGPILKHFKPGLQLHYYTDHHRLESYKAELKKSPLGGNKFMFTYERHY